MSMSILVFESKKLSVSEILLKKLLRNIFLKCIRVVLFKKDGERKLLISIFCMNNKGIKKIVTRTRKVNHKKKTKKNYT